MNAPQTPPVDPFNKVDYTNAQHPSGVKALSLADAPALIERLLPAQKLSADVFKERSAGSGQTLTALGSYWKGRKPLVLNRACVLASLLPSTDEPVRDLEIFEMLMGMDDISMSKRLGLATPKTIVSKVSIANIWDYFKVSPDDQRERLPKSAPFSLNDFPYIDKKGVARVPLLSWRDELSESDKHAVSARLFEEKPYRELVSEALRAEEIPDSISTHIWDEVNEHLGTNANNFPDFIEQLGVMRFGHRPTIADTFSGSGQIPFAAAQLGCDTYASDLNPVACMLTWGAFNIVGASKSKRALIEQEQKKLVEKVREEIDRLGFELDGRGWRGKVYLYCLEVTCPSSGWRVPVLPTRVVSKSKSAVAELVPIPDEKRYGIKIVSDVDDQKLKEAEIGTYIKGAVIHTVDGVEHSNLISSIRGDYTETTSGEKVKRNKLRAWRKSDIVFRDDDVYGERLYAIQWVKDDGSLRPVTEFRSVTQEDETREKALIAYVQKNLEIWQKCGWIPDMRIESGEKTDEPIRTRGWTYWHHLFNPRQLLGGYLIRSLAQTADTLFLNTYLNNNARLSRWHGGRDYVTEVFDNQALNTLYNYATQGVRQTLRYFNLSRISSCEVGNYLIVNHASSEIAIPVDIFVTDPPYGDAVKYEEIYELFMSWLQKHQPSPFDTWNWNSRRELAIKGEDHDFKLNMVKAYKRMADCMPDNGLQIIMFTHQDAGIWADMANIVWASGLRVTAAWYLVTETDSALRDGSYVKGTILLVLRKRLGKLSGFQSEIAEEIEMEVAKQIQQMTGLNDDVAKTKRAKDGNLFGDADFQMAGYAAGLKVLTSYSEIDGKDMVQESLKETIKGQKNIVRELIDFAVQSANKQIFPDEFDKNVWKSLSAAEHFYLKMVDLEAKGLNTLDNYQTMAKAFSVKDWGALMASDKANKAKLKNAVQLGKSEMGQGSEIANTPTRAVLYALMEMQAGKDVEDAVKTLTHNMPNFYSERQTVRHISQYLGKKRRDTNENEAKEARILAMYLENQGA